jgi:hypothetical protein
MVWEHIRVTLISATSLPTSLPNTENQMISLF